MKRRSLPYSTQSIGGDDVRSVAKALRSAWLTQGPAVEEFERRFARSVGAKFAVALSSGTAALHAACFAAGLGPGDEAVVPPITFVATANAVLYAGATPVFADVDPETALLDPQAFLARVTRKTRAVLPVDYAGHPCALDQISRIARRRGIIVIEDAAHAMGARYRKQPVGSLSDMTIFSFHPVKHMTTGEGGMVTTDRGDFSARVRRFRQHGITKDAKELKRDEGPWYYEMHDLGFNYRLTDFQSALGLSQLRKVGGFVAARRRLAAAYDRLLGDVEGVSIPPERPWARHSYHLYPVRVEAKRRRRLFEALRARGIGVQVHYYPVHLQPYYRRLLGTAEGLCPNAEAFYASEISLPVFPGMNGEDVRRVVGELRRALAAGT